MAANRTKLIISGVSTDVCLAFVSLSALAAGFEVYAVVDASGTFSPLMKDLAIARMVQAGIYPMTFFAVTGEL
jgi:nicotinamidase-related amidase